MTNNNNLILTSSIERGDKISKNGIDEVREVARIRRIDHERFRIDSTDGDVAVAHRDDLWELFD